MTSRATDSLAAPAPQAHPAPGTVGTVADPATASLPRPGSLPTRAQEAAAKKDKVLTSPAAIELAHEALGEITEPLSVGAHVGMRTEDQRLVTHLFECNLAGYRGWRWAVTLTRPPRARSATVCEMELLPGEDAILTPAWIPWADRLQPGDISRSDRLPKRETDERLEPGWEATGEDEGDVVGTDALDFGRARVLSAQGVSAAAQRWYDGDQGPRADGVRKAHASCATCGFLMPLAGPLRNVFGLCANEWAVDDGRVVSLDHGCGAHSETDLPDQGPAWPVMPSRLDEGAMEPIGTDGKSIRGGEALAEAADSSLETPERASGEEAAAGGGSAEAGESGEPGEAERPESPEKAAKSEKSAKPRRAKRAGKLAAAPKAEEAGEADSRSAEAAQDGDGSQSGQAAVAEPAAPESAASPLEASPAVEDQRHAAALDAVAELAASRPAHAAHPAHPEGGEHTPTLADLEAHLPFGH